LRGSPGWNRQLRAGVTSQCEGGGGGVDTSLPSCTGSGWIQVNVTRLRPCGLGGSQEEHQRKAFTFFRMTGTGMVRGAYGHPVAAGHREVARQWRQSCMHYHCRQHSKAGAVLVGPSFFVEGAITGFQAAQRRPPKTDLGRPRPMLPLTSGARAAAQQLPS
jgi:hypothetical protein